MRRLSLCALLALSATAAGAAPIVFDTDPFAGSTALATPGRQIIGGELLTAFDPALDQFVFGPGFNLAGYAPGTTSLTVANGALASLPASGANVLVLRTFDNDAEPTTAFGAGAAATLIAGQVTSPGAGFFVYFNSALDLPRLVFSTDLDDPTADLKVLARLTNLTGSAGQAALAGFGANNFSLATGQPVSEPPALALLLVALALGGAPGLRRRLR